MTKYQIEVLNTMRGRGKSAMDIALALHISVNTIRSYMRRHPPEDVLQVECLWCGKPIVQVKGRKAKRFCSDKCRNTWWLLPCLLCRCKKLSSCTGSCRQCWSTAAVRENWTNRPVTVPKGFLP